VPKLRDSLSTQNEANRLAAAVQQWLLDSDPTMLFQTCCTCTHWDRKENHCGKFKRVPPVEVIAGRVTCPQHWDAEDIPF
jgi:hypothetical protein